MQDNRLLILAKVFGYNPNTNRSIRSFSPVHLKMKKQSPPQQQSNNWLVPQSPSANTCFLRWVADRLGLLGCEKLLSSSFWNVKFSSTNQRKHFRESKRHCWCQHKKSESLTHLYSRVNPLEAFH